MIRRQQQSSGREPPVPQHRRRARRTWNWSCTNRTPPVGRSMRLHHHLDSWFTRYGQLLPDTAAPTVLFVTNPTAAQRANPVSGRQLHGAALRQHRQEGPRTRRTSSTCAPTCLHQAGRSAARSTPRPTPGPTKSTRKNSSDAPAAPHGAVQHQALGLARRAPERLRARGKPVRQALLPHRTRCGRFNMDGRYNSQDPSIVVDPGRTWRLGLSLQF